MRKNINVLKKKLLNSLLSFGYINKVKIEDYEKVHFYLEKLNNDSGVLIDVINSHNSYLAKDLSIYRDVAKRLIVAGYEIKMTFPHYITVTGHVE